VNPLAGWKEFTAEIVFQPYADGAKEQRFFHLQEDGTENQFQPQSAGKSSIGVRINRVFWYRGAIRQIRISPRVLAPSEFLKPH
jgi:hypothetical protein